MDILIGGTINCCWQGKNTTIVLVDVHMKLGRGLDKYLVPVLVRGAACPAKDSPVYMVCRLECNTLVADVIEPSEQVQDPGINHVLTTGVFKKIGDQEYFDGMPVPIGLGLADFLGVKAHCLGYIKVSNGTTYLMPEKIFAVDSLLHGIAEAESGGVLATEGMVENPAPDEGSIVVHGGHTYIPF